MIKLNKEETKKMNNYLLKYMEQYTDNEALKEYLKKYSEYKLGNRQLGMIFEILAAPDTDGFSREVKMSELIEYNVSFDTGNGRTWSRDTQYIGKKYEVKHFRKNGRTGKLIGFKLEGFNKNPRIDQYVRADIRKKIKENRCSILDVGTNIECDHKDGKKDDWRLNNKKSQLESDFMALSKAANIAKRDHCEVCKATGKRYDAKNLGYSHSFTKGDFDTNNCQGCYWYDPKKFNAEISAMFEKNV